MALRGATARRYAESVFAIARDQNTFDRWLEDLATIRAVFTNPDMARLLADPKPGLREKEAVAERLLRGKVEPLALNLARLLIQRQVAGLIVDIERDMQAMVNEDRNIAVAEVTTAVELDRQQLDVLKQRLEVLTAKTIRIEPRIDKSILGGFIARVGDVLIDASLTTRLASMRRELLAHT